MTKHKSRHVPVTGPIRSGVVTMLAGPVEAQMKSLEQLPGAQLLQPDETPFAGCSALVVLEEVGTSCSRPPPHVLFRSMHQAHIAGGQARGLHAG